MSKWENGKIASKDGVIECAYCPFCKRIALMKTDYCPNCGTDMREKEVIADLQGNWF